VSPGGLYVVTPRPHSAGSRHIISFTYEQLTFCAEAEVVRADEGGMAMAFVSLDTLREQVLAAAA
jgi:hypothetical protein